MVQQRPEPPWSFKSKFEASHGILSRTAVQVHILEDVRVRATAVLAEFASHPLTMYRRGRGMWVALTQVRRHTPPQRSGLEPGLSRYGALRSNRRRRSGSQRGE